MAADGSEAVVGFNLPTRCCTAIQTEDSPLFLVGSCSVRDENEVQSFTLFMMAFSWLLYRFHYSYT